MGTKGFELWVDLILVGKKARKRNCTGTRPVELEQSVLGNVKIIFK